MKRKDFEALFPVIIVKTVFIDAKYIASFILTILFRNKYSH